MINTRVICTKRPCSSHKLESCSLFYNISCISRYSIIIWMVFPMVISRCTHWYLSSKIPI